MDRLTVAHAAGLYLAGVGIHDNPDIFPFGHPDLDRCEVREADGTTYVKVAGEDGNLLAVYREAGESEFEYAENCPTIIFGY